MIEEYLLYDWERYSAGILAYSKEPVEIVLADRVQRLLREVRELENKRTVLNENH